MSRSVFVCTRRITGPDGREFAQSAVVIADGESSARQLLSQNLSEIRRSSIDAEPLYGTVPPWQVYESQLDQDRVVMLATTT
jgi:hypothetical protein